MKKLLFLVIIAVSLMASVNSTEGRVTSIAAEMESIWDVIETNGGEGTFIHVCESIAIIVGSNEESSAEIHYEIGQIATKFIGLVVSSAGENSEVYKDIFKQITMLKNELS